MKKVIAKIKKQLFDESLEYSRNVVHINREKIAEFFKVSNLGDVVLSPFSKVGDSEIVRCPVMLNFKGIGAIEINPNTEELSCLDLEYLEQEWADISSEVEKPLPVEKSSKNGLEIDLIMALQNYVAKGDEASKLHSKCEHMLMMFEPDLVKYVDLKNKFGG